MYRYFYNLRFSSANSTPGELSHTSKYPFANHQGSYGISPNSQGLVTAENAARAMLLLNKNANTMHWFVKPLEAE